MDVILREKFYVKISIFFLSETPTLEGIYVLTRIALITRVCSRFFDQVGHETMYVSSGNKHFFTKYCHRQTYQTYEQSLQKLGTILENKLP